MDFIIRGILSRSLGLIMKDSHSLTHFSKIVSCLDI